MGHMGAPRIVPMSSAVNAAPNLTALGRPDSESAAHAYRAAQAAGWLIDDSDLLSLGSLEQTLATASRLRDLGVVVRLGHAGQPDPKLETALLASPGQVTAVGSIRIEPEWRWVARTAAPRPTVVIDTVALRECGHRLAELGVIPRVVPPSASLRSRIELTADGSSLIIESGLVPAGWSELPGGDVLRTLPELWFGLIRNTRTATMIDGDVTVWLAFGPRIDETGTLKRLLAEFAEFNIDLSHLRSAAGSDGRHVFLSAFVIQEKVVLNRLLERLTERRVQHRVLAVLPGAHTTHAAAQVAPEWSPYE